MTFLVKLGADDGDIIYEVETATHAYEFFSKYDHELIKIEVTVTAKEGEAALLLQTLMKELP